MISDAMGGGLAGVGASALWVATSIFVTHGARHLGTTRVNALRIGIAMVLLAVHYAVVSGGAWWPQMTGTQLSCLAVSGVLGLAICDQCLFQSFLDIGPRRALLVMTTSPIFALAFGALFLGETVGVRGLVGIALTLGGVMWVVAERVPPTDGVAPVAGASALRRGLFLAVIAAALQAAGGGLGKRGMGHGLLPEAEHLSPLAATYVRMVFGALGMVPMVLFALRRAPSIPGNLGRGLGWTMAAAVVGPYYGVWLSLIAFDRSPIGVAQTLLSLQPVFILPLAGPVFGERVSLRAVLGAAAAVGGAVLLFADLQGG